MNTGKHTPLVVREAFASTPTFHICLAGKAPAGVIATTIKREHAERMVLCWNSHDELCEAVKRLLNCMDLAGWENDPTAEFARAALSKATGGAS